LAFRPAALGALEDRTLFDTPLGTALNYNALIFGSLTNVNGGDTEGWLAVGGDANLTSWGVGNRLTPNPASDALIVGGNLTYTIRDGGGRGSVVRRLGADLDEYVECIVVDGAEQGRCP
jgi:choice-of-anchor A domain-containing protein